MYDDEFNESNIELSDDDIAALYGYAEREPKPASPKATAPKQNLPAPSARDSVTAFPPVALPVALPELISCAGIKDLEITESPELVAGLIRLGELVVFAADAKMGKTWLGIELAHAVACGGSWLGFDIAITGAVVYLNYELQGSTFLIRMKTVCRQRGAFPEKLHSLNMRGIEATVPEVARHIADHCKAEGVVLIVMDSLYNTFGARSENDNSEMSIHMSEIIKVCGDTGAAIVALHHFSKSSFAAPTDSARSSGASSIHRKADALVTATRLTAKEIKDLGLSDDEVSHARVSTSPRSFRETPPFIISKAMGDWKYERQADSMGELLAAAKAGKIADPDARKKLTVAKLSGFIGKMAYDPADLDTLAARAFHVAPKTAARRRIEGLSDGSFSLNKDGKIVANFIKTPATSRNLPYSDADDSLES